MVQAPLKIRALRDAGYLEILWSPDQCWRYPFKFLRCECPCAGCVNEFTGERILNPDSVPADILPASIGFSGNYALKIQWTDRHETGLYSWEHLNRLGDAPEVEHLTADEIASAGGEQGTGDRG